jgi:hypothetical protein
MSVHPSQDYLSDDNLRNMAEELHFEKKKDLENYVKCDYSFERYIERLKMENLL